MFLSKALTVAMLTVMMLFSHPVGAENQPVETETAGKVELVERTGVKLPLDAEFVDENGNTVTLGELIDRPTILIPNYFTCPNSCSINLANLAGALNRMKLEPGADYRVIALSFNHRETPPQANSAKQNYLALLYNGFPPEQWLFLTGAQDQIDRVLDTIGYTYKPLPDGTFMHPTALVSVGADGTVIKYVYGKFIPGDVELALVEAKSGDPAVSIKRFLEYCFNYDPNANKGPFQLVKFGMLGLFGVAAVWFSIRYLFKRESPSSLS